MNEELKLPVTTTQIPEGLELITLGGGCFWCTEAVFQHLEGVEKVISGYSNGYVENPSYREICSGTTGHAEVVQVFFDPDKISLRKILEVFFATHDPTTVNRQGNDTGPQYRSAIFYTTVSQENIAMDLINGLNNQDIYDKKIVTEVAELQNFYPADDYHQDYYNLNGHQPYCQFVIKPKVNKLEKYFKDLMKE
ncbi:peptide-methionine (S)-S-oxide reductase MsrA [Algoriphagus machipongonensis]|uniref:Peptide methionine sulfoxide reductase MsrA n=1 Tax=Algoriphagus machipongonensis TaxID=388413 RepID=A3HSP0_9BACT|nr:peptide-methionine (S)-S-oxide reductase MsrA [Algoriphagus machipongonensis]EAZ82858.1 peptide-methionine (S)-S-oxide reductase [Algoriphagus machipongonensis]